MKVETYNPTHEQMTAIGERLKTVRTANELSEEEFAGRICTYVNLYCHAERGHDTIPYHAIKLVSYEFGVSLSWLLQGIPTDGDPDYCTETENGQSLFNSSVSIKEAVWDYSTDNGMDMWTNEVEDKKEHIERMVKFFSEHPSDLRKDHIERMTNYIDDTIALANYDGYTAGWRTAIQLVKGLLGLSGLPEEPPAVPKSDRVISPEIVIAVRKAKPKETAKVTIHKANT